MTKPTYEEMMRVFDFVVGIVNRHEKDDDVIRVLVESQFIGFFPMDFQAPAYLSYLVLLVKDRGEKPRFELATPHIAEAVAVALNRIKKSHNVHKEANAILDEGFVFPSFVPEDNDERPR